MADNHTINDMTDILIKHVANMNSKTVHLGGAETVTGDKAFTGGVTVGGYVPECVVDKGNGYIRYSSGLQMCWGCVTVNGVITDTNTKVTFPVAFKLTPAVLTTGNANYLGNNVMVGWETATSFTIGTTRESPAVGKTSWFAIGYWK